MARRRQDFAIIVLRCAIAGFGACAQQAVLGSEMVMPSKPAIEAIQDVVSSNMSLSSGVRLPDSSNTPPAPLVLSQSDPVTTASQEAGNNGIGAQETKDVNIPSEPQAVMREIKSATGLSGSKRWRRKPKMAGVPTGLQAVAQEAQAPVTQAVAQEAQAPVTQAVAQEAKKTLVSPIPQAEPGEIKVKGIGKRRYGMAPIQWGIRLSETIGLERHSETFHGVPSPNVATSTLRATQTTNSLVNTQTAEIHAKTYVMQPYIAQMKGTLGIIHRKDDSRNGTAFGSSPGSFETSKSVHGNNWFGDGSVSLFSQSRFPFGMSLGVSDSRDTDGFDNQDTVRKYLTMSQSYTPLQSTSTYNVGYGADTSNILGSLGGGVPSEVAKRSHWLGSYSTFNDEHRIIAETRYKDKFTSTYRNTDNRTDTYKVQDIYMPSESLLTLQSIADVRLTKENSDLGQLRAHDVRAITYGKWQPEDEDIHLFMDGNVRLSSSTNANSLMTTQGPVAVSQSLAGNIAANYFFSKNLRGYANVGALNTNTNGVRDHTTTQTGRVTYTSDIIRVWKNSSYSWDINGGAANQTGTGKDVSVFGGVGHNLNIPYPFEVRGKRLTMNTRIRQSLDDTISRVDHQSYRLVNGGSLMLGGTLASLHPNKEMMGGYGVSEGGVTSAVTVSVLDTRIIGGKNPSHKQTYSLMLDLKETTKTVYSREGLEIEGTLGASQGTEVTEIFGKGIVRYKKARVYNVRGLDYIGTLTVNPRRTSHATTGIDANAQNPILPWILDQRLTYKIGQNEVLLRGLFSDSYGTKNASLWLLFRAWRTIGN